MRTVAEGHKRCLRAPLKALDLIGMCATATMSPCTFNIRIQLHPQGCLITSVTLEGAIDFL